MTKYTWTADERITKTLMDEMLYQNADGESADDLTKLAVKDQSGAGSFALQLLSSETLSADRALTLTVNDAARTVDLSGDVTLAGDLTTDAAVTVSGAFALTLTVGAISNITLPQGTKTVPALSDANVWTGVQTLAASTIVGGSCTELTGLSIRSSGGNDLVIASSAVYTADRTLTINIPTTANAALTLTGDLIRVGAHSLTLTTSGATNVTLPTTGTLATTAVTALTSLITVGTITTGTWNATVVTATYGGTGLATITDHGVMLGSGTGAVSVTSAGTSGQPLLSSGAAADPDWGTLGANYGGTGLTTITDHGIMLGSGTGAVTPMSAGSAGQLVRSAGAAADPAWTTLTMPATIGANEIFYASSANTLGVIAAAASSVLVTSAGSVPSMATDIPTAVTIGAAYIYRVGGTDVALADGGTNASLTAANGGIVYSTAAALAITAAGSAGQIIRSGGAGAPTWSTFTIPATYAINTLIYASGANVLGTIAAANSSVLVTGAGGVPSLATDIPTAVTIGAAYIYRAGGTDVAVADGGTGLGTYTVGDIIHATGAGVLAGLADVAVGQVLCSGGVGVVAAWSATPTFTSSVQSGRGEVGRLNLKDDTGLTLDGNGEVTVTQSYHSLDTFGAGATDDLEAISGGAEGDIIIIYPVDATHTIVAQHAGAATAGDILNLAGGVNFTMDEDDDFLMLLHDGTVWQEISRSENHA